MTLTIELPGQLRARLEAEARRSGLAVEQYALRILEDTLTTRDLTESGRSPVGETAAMEDRVREFDQMVESFHDISAPDIPPEALRRETME